MEPNYNIGDIVIVKKCKADDIKVGDVISFRNGQSVITHRVENILKTEDNLEFETKGDNNNTKDLSPIKATQIEGKTIAKIRKIGYLSLFLQNKTSVIVIMFIFFIMYLYSSKKEEKRKKRRIKREIYEEERLKKRIREVRNSGKEEKY